MRSLLTILLMVMSIAFYAQQNEMTSTWMATVGYRLLPIPSCDCSFEPVEFDSKFKSHAVFTGATYNSKSGFFFALDVGYFKRAFVQSGVSGGYGSRPYYQNGVTISVPGDIFFNESQTLFQGSYLSGALGPTFGIHRLKFSILTRFDYYLEKSYSYSLVTSRFKNTPYLDDHYPDTKPFEVMSYENDGGVKERSAAAFIGFRFTYDITDRIGIIASSELQYLRLYDGSNGMNKTVARPGSYQIAVSYAFSR